MRSNHLMLLRIAQGDAYAAAVEYVKPEEYQDLYEQAYRFERYLKHPTHNLKHGQYTDDTQMSIAVAEVLLGNDLSDRAFIDAFVRCFKRDPRDGYARGFQEFLEGIKDADEFAAKIRNNSEKNGAAMRAVPIGILPNVEDVLKVAEINANITHRTPIGIWSSKAVALMSHFAFYVYGSSHAYSDVKAMGFWCEKHLPGFIRNVVFESEPVRVIAPDLTLKTIRGAYSAIIRAKNYQEAMTMIIKCGGDVDTVAAIAFGIGSSFWKEELPPSVEYGLEDGPYGRRFLVDLGQRLMDKYKQPA